MNLYNSMFSQDAMFNELLAEQIFGMIPEQGPLVVIMDNEGNCRASDSELFEKLNLNKEWIDNFCSKISDGVEPVISHIDNYGVIGAQLIGEHNMCGYVIMVTEEAGLESMLAKIELLEMILNQFNLIAQLTEKCNTFYQIQAKLSSSVLNN